MGILQLSRPVEFEGVSPVTAVFYDDQCGHVISVRGGGVTGVRVRGINTSTNNNNVLTHRLADSPGSGPIISIKLSPSLATLSVQRSVNSVSFIPVTGASSSSGDLEYSQAARAKACSVLGFVWLSNSDLVYVTDGGVELYTVHQVGGTISILTMWCVWLMSQDKRTVKYSRSVSEPVCWYSHRSGPVLVTSPSQETDSVTVWCVR